MNSRRSQHQAFSFAPLLALAALGAAAGIFLAMQAAGGFAGQATVESHELEPASLAASFATGWQSPADARRALESRTEALMRLVTTHGGAVRVVSTNSLLRTRTEQGTRLAEPIAQFERTFELLLAASQDDSALREALAGASIRLEAVSAGRHASSSANGESGAVARAPGIRPRD